MDDFLADETNDEFLLIEDISLKLVDNQDNFIENNLYVVKNFMVSQPILFWMNRGNDYQQLFQNFVSKSKSVGMHLKKFNFDKFNKGSRTAKYAKKVTIEEFWPAIFLMVAGLVLGYVVLLIEYYIVWCSKIKCNTRLKLKLRWILYNTNFVWNKYLKWLKCIV